MVARALGEREWKLFLSRYIPSLWDDEKVLNAINAIQKSLKMANNTLLTLKSGNKIELISTSLSQLIESAIDLAKVYLDGNDIELQVEMPEDINVVVDVESLTAVLINLVKNATEAFLQDILEENDVQENGKYIIYIKNDVETKKIELNLPKNNGPIFFQ